MSETTFTEGTWLFIVDGIYTITGEDEDARLGSRIAMAPPAPDGENWVADSRLIAAAPELYDVAALALDVLAAQQTYFKTRAKDDLVKSKQLEAELKRAATAATTKARGEA